MIELHPDITRIGKASDDTLQYKVCAEKAWLSATLPLRLPAHGRTAKTTTRWTMATRWTTAASCARLMRTPRPMHMIRLDNQSQARHTDLHEHSMLDYQHHTFHRHTVDGLQLRSPRSINATAPPRRGELHAPQQPMDQPWMACMDGLLPVHRQLMRQARR